MFWNREAPPLPNTEVDTTQPPETVAGTDEHSLDSSATHLQEHSPETKTGAGAMAYRAGWLLQKIPNAIVVAESSIAQIMHKHRDMYPKSDQVFDSGFEELGGFFEDKVEQVVKDISEGSGTTIPYVIVAQKTGVIVYDVLHREPLLMDNTSFVDGRWESENGIPLFTKLGTEGWSNTMETTEAEEDEFTAFRKQKEAGRNIELHHPVAEEKTAAEGEPQGYKKAA